MADTFGFSEGGVERIVRTVRTVESYPVGLGQELPEIPEALSPGFDFVRGKLDASLTMDGTADVSVYDTSDNDTGDTIEVEAGKFVGYLSTNSWVLCLDDGEKWRVVTPLGRSGVGKADAVAAEDANATISVYRYVGGVYTDTTDNITARCVTPLAASERVWWQYDPRGIFEVKSLAGVSGLGKADAAVAEGATGTISVYYWSGSTFTDTTDNITCRALAGIPDEHRVIWQWDSRSAQFVVWPIDASGLGTADAAIAQDATGTVSVKYFSGGTFTDSTDNITCRAIGAVASGDRVSWWWDSRSDQFICGCVAQ